MDTMTQQARAAALRALHQGPSPLLLPTAWDVVSARLFEEAGCRALGTTSAGIAATLGYFGRDVHACPGDMLALTIAQAGIAQVLASGIELAQLVRRVTYRASVNTRIPLFARASTA
jgi:2-methylisocitrate lyase-like PEP mutase family enzyme